MKTYKQIRAELDRLQREADSVRKSKAAVVIARMKKTIEEYGLTAADLGLDGGQAAGADERPSAKTASKSASRKAPGRKAAAKKSGCGSGAGVVKYRDAQTGERWTGGPEPQTSFMAGIVEKNASEQQSCASLRCISAVCGCPRKEF